MTLSAPPGESDGRPYHTLYGVTARDPGREAHVSGSRARTRAASTSVGQIGAQSARSSSRARPPKSQTLVTPVTRQVTGWGLDLNVCGGGGIGRRDGLKSHCPKGLWVRIPPAALNCGMRTREEVVAGSDASIAEGPERLRDSSSHRNPAPERCSNWLSAERHHGSGLPRAWRSGISTCPTCGHEAPRSSGTLPIPEYTYLLGVYLGDGCISTERQRVDSRAAPLSGHALRGPDR